MVDDCIVSIHRDRTKISQSPCIASRFPCPFKKQFTDNTNFSSRFVRRSPLAAAEITYDQGSSAGASSALRNAALELEAAALPAHYQLDEKQLRKLPNLETKDFVKGLLMMNER